MSLLNKLKEEKEFIKNLGIAKSIIDKCKINENEIDVNKVIILLEQNNISLSYIQKETKKHDYLLNEEIKQTISQIIGLPYEKIINMPSKQFEEFIKNKVKDVETYNIDKINKRIKWKEIYGIKNIYNKNIILFYT